MAADDESGAVPAELVRIPAGQGSDFPGKATPMEEITTIGRSPGNTITIDEDLVSRHHAMIRREARRYVLVDLGSANGTFVNARPISGPTNLKHGDELRFGDAVFAVRYPDQAPDSPTTGSKSATRRVFAAVNVAVLVSDIRNYTTLSEYVPADNLSTFLSEWFRWAGKSIEKHSGIIEKFRGDSLMAYWTSGGSGGTDHVAHAVDAARELVSASREFAVRMNREYPQGTFKIGCGVHVGDAVLGNIGADARRDFTTTGDCVNVTFRIESMCSTLDREILVSDDVRKLLTDDSTFEDLGEQALKGKSESIRLFAVRTGD